MPTFHLQPRAAEHLPACVDLLHAVHQSDGYPANWPEDAGAWLSPPGLTGAWVATGDVRVLGHLALGEPTRSALGPFDDTITDGQLLTVSRFFVASSARRHGVGRALLEHAVAVAGEHGHRLVLELAQSGTSAPAGGLYQRAGWSHVATSTAPWTTPDGHHPVVHHYLAPTV